MAAQRADGARGGIGSVRDANGRANAFLVGLPPSEQHDQSVVGFGDVTDVEGYEFGPAKGGGVHEQHERPVADIDRSDRYRATVAGTAGSGSNPRSSHHLMNPRQSDRYPRRVAGALAASA